jgi:hypothetical protein
VPDKGAAYGFARTLGGVQGGHEISALRFPKGGNWGENKFFRKERRSMRKKIRTIILLGLLFLTCPLRADIFWTEGHHEINANETYGEIWMYNDCTLDIFGGEIARVAAYDTTITNWYGGQMYELWAKENSIVNIYGGQLLYPSGGSGYLWLADNSIINIFAYDVTFTPNGIGWGQGQLKGKYYLDNNNFILYLPNNGDYSHINIVPEPATFLLLALSGLLLKKRKQHN